MRTAKHTVIIVLWMFVLAALLSCGSVAYYQYCQLREKAERLALETVMQMSDVQGTDRDFHVETLWDMDEDKIDASIEEMVRFKKNMVREKRQQRAAIAGDCGREFHVSDSFGSMETEATSLSAGDSGSKARKIYGSRKALVLSGETVMDEISCNYCAVCIEEPLLLVQFLGMDGFDWSYTTLATSLGAMPKI